MGQRVWSKVMRSPKKRKTNTRPTHRMTERDVRYGPRALKYRGNRQIATICIVSIVSTTGAGAHRNSERDP